MAHIFARNTMTVGLNLPGIVRQSEDYYYLRPPIAGIAPWDGVASAGPSAGAVQQLMPGWFRTLAPGNYPIGDATLQEITIAYGNGEYFWRYYYELAASADGPLQKVWGASLLNSEGEAILEIGSSTQNPVFVLNLTTQEIFGEDGGFAGFRGEVDLWQLLLASESHTDIWGTAQADVIRLSNRSGSHRISGGAGNDTLTGGAGEDYIRGGEGIDLLDGGAGSLDDVGFGESTLPINVTLNGATYTTAMIGGVAGDVLRNFEGVDGGDGADTIVGDMLANDFEGDNGNDTLLGLGGDDILQGQDGVDRLDGGVGFDHAIFFWDDATVRVTLSGGTQTTALLDGISSDTLINIEAVAGGYFDDTLVGDALANVLAGNDGNDYLDGKGGNDTLFGSQFGFQADIDTLVGGIGVDTVSWGTYSRNDALFGWGVGVSSFTSIAVALAGAAAVPVSFNGAFSGTLAGVENLVGGDGNDTFSGDLLANRLDGGAGNDLLIGGAGADVLVGGAGSDVLNGGVGTDMADYSANTVAGAILGVYVTLSAGTPVTLWFGDGVETDSLVNIENLRGSSLGDYIGGDALANTLSGMAGNDFLEGHGGKDLLDGGAGLDTASFADKTQAVAITLNGATAVSAVVGGAGEDTLINIEHLIGGFGNDTFLGDSRNNTLIGGEGADSLSGGGGADLLSGGPGQDWMDGGAGFDRVDYSTEGSGISVVLNGANTVQVSIGNLSPDSILNVENIAGGAGNDSLTGDLLRNNLDGGSGSDVLNGRSGSDVLFGGLDSDTDFFVFDTALGPNNVDVLEEFDSQYDKIVLDDDVFTRFLGNQSGVPVNPNNFVSGYGATALDGNDYLILDTDENTLSYDADGSGSGLAVIIARIYSDTYGISASNFLIIA
jgi:Ca2+-binding RTX toxin-like protein